VKAELLVLIVKELLWGQRLKLAMELMMIAMESLIIWAAAFQALLAAGLDAAAQVRLNVKLPEAGCNVQLCQAEPQPIISQNSAMALMMTAMEALMKISISEKDAASLACAGQAWNDAEISSITNVPQKMPEA